MTQAERRLYLIRALLSEQPELCREMRIPSDTEAQNRLLRALFNVRPPIPASPEFLGVQNAYLQEELARKGITDADSLDDIISGVCLWRGDITTLRCDAIVNAANSALLGCFCPNHGCIDNAIHTFADEGWYAARRRYAAFIKAHERSNLLLMELGVGFNTPGAIKLPFWQLTAENPRAVYACLNMNEAFCLDKIRVRSICINRDLGETLACLGY